MPETCCAVGCANRRGQKEGVSFYRIPVEKERRDKWIAAIKRESWMPTEYTRLCSEHFISGAKSDHPLSPDYVPSIFKHVPSPKKRQHAKHMDKFQHRQEMKRRRVEISKRTDAAEMLMTLSELPDAPDHVDQISDSVIGSISQDTVSDTTSVESQECENEMCKKRYEALEKECIALREELYHLREVVKNVKFDEMAFKNNDDKVQALTGLPSYAKLSVVHGCMQTFLKTRSALTPFEQIVMTLMRLKINLPLYLLGQLFNVSSGTASRLFNNSVKVMNSVLTPPMVFWPQREELRLSLPMSFRSVFKDCACIIDCFEVFIEKPSDLRARAQTYSQYKHHNTMKYLIGITPQGVVSFISKGWGGRTSDKHITENCGFLENLLPGDVILADRGFLVGDSINLYNAKLKIPAFTRGKKQLSPVDIEATRGLAAVRIHVERVIGHVRQKYSMLSGTIPINLCESQYDGGPTTLDLIVQLCCSLTNMCQSVVPFD